MTETHRVPPALDYLCFQRLPRIQGSPDFEKQHGHWMHDETSFKLVDGEKIKTHRQARGLGAWSLRRLEAGEGPTSRLHLLSKWFGSHQV